MNNLTDIVLSRLNGGVPDTPTGSGLVVSAPTWPTPNQTVGMAPLTPVTSLTSDGQTDCGFSLLSFLAGLLLSAAVLVVAKWGE